MVEVDGRDRMVDVYRWHLAHPASAWPRLSYWGHYVAHDNNRDAMGMTLSLTRNVLDTHLGWHAQVLHDLHESVPFLYDNTVGDGPYNAWVDPLLTNEWQLFGWSNVGEMTKLGMPGVFTHGEFDTWSPGYLMFLAAMHNSDQPALRDLRQRRRRHRGARALARSSTRAPGTARIRPGRASSGRSATTTTTSRRASWSRSPSRPRTATQLLSNFYAKAKRSIDKPQREGPAAWVLPADDRRPEAQAELLRVLARQHVEISPHSRPSRSRRGAPQRRQPTRRPSRRARPAPRRRRERRRPSASSRPAATSCAWTSPTAAIADALLDRQYWSPDDPQKHPYDDTGWSFGELFDVEAVRVIDGEILAAPMSRVDGAGAPRRPASPAAGPVFLVAQRGADAMLPLRYALGDAAAKRLRREGRGRDGALPRRRRATSRAAAGSSPASTASGSDGDRRRGRRRRRRPRRAPAVATRPVPSPRLALLHSWLSTQTEGWWRQRLDLLGVPYDYISTQDVAATPDLGAKYDVILFPPVGVGEPQRIVTGLPMLGEPLPWKTTPETPNLGKIDATDDQRPGLGFAGLEHLRRFVEDGGLLVAVEDTAELLIANGLAPGVRVTDADDVKVVGTVLDARFPASQESAPSRSPKASATGCRSTAPRG